MVTISPLSKILLLVSLINSSLQQATSSNENDRSRFTTSNDTVALLSSSTGLTFSTSSTSGVSTSVSLSESLLSSSSTTISTTLSSSSQSLTSSSASESSTQLTQISSGTTSSLSTELSQSSLTLSSSISNIISSTSSNIQTTTSISPSSTFSISSTTTTSPLNTETSISSQGSFTTTRESSKSIRITTIISGRTVIQNFLTTITFIPTGSTDNNLTNKNDNNSGLSRKNRNIVIGCTIGLGVPLLFAIFGVIYFYCIRSTKTNFINSEGKVITTYSKNKFTKWWLALLGKNVDKYETDSPVGNIDMDNDEDQIHSDINSDIIVNRGGSSRGPHSKELVLEEKYYDNDGNEITARNY